MSDIKKAAKAEELSSFFNELSVTLDDLHGALENEDEEGIEAAYDNFPTVKAIERACVKLGAVMASKPAKKRKEG